MTAPAIPYSRQSIDQDDIAEVCKVLSSDWLTGGPQVERFEAQVCSYTGAAHAVALSSGTAALHAAMFALGIGQGDEVIVTPMSFAASANCILYQGAKPVFADVQPDTLLLDPARVEAAISPRTKAIIGVDYAGQPCDWAALHEIADKYGLALIDDACHALGASLDGKKIGTLADITVFSFHPVKAITTGEGGMAQCQESLYAERMRSFRNHGITSSAAEREESGAWFYEMTDLGYNYRITDFQCALGTTQLKKLDGWIAQRQQLAARYDERFLGLDSLRPLSVRDPSGHARHLYVVRAKDRDGLFKELRARGIGVNVHYIPIHLHPYYKKLGYTEGLCPVAEAAYREIISLPLWPGLAHESQDAVSEAVLAHY